MIKLEELKKGDKVYAVFYDEKYRDVGKYADTEVLQELCVIKYPEPIEGVWCDGGINILTRDHEKILFKTEEERDNEVNRIRNEIINNFMNDDYLKNKLFECAASGKRLDKYYRELFKEILGLE